MGMEINNVASGATASFQSQPVAKVPKAEAAPKVEAPEAAVSQAIAKDTQVISQVSSENKQGSENDAEKQSRKQPDSLMEAAKDINKKINNNTIAEFGYHEATRRITIKIKDKDTDEVIKEIPSEKALEMLEKAWELAGIMVDEKR